MPDFQGEEQLRDLQLKGLQWTTAHAYRGCEAYRQKMDQAGVAPGDIRSLEDLARLPFTTADDLRRGYPFPLLSVPLERVVRIHASSGTTGKRKVLCYTQKDIDDWADMFARCYEMAGLADHDRVQIGVGYGVWTAGVGFQNGCERFGAMAVPVGPGNLDMHCQFLVDFQSTVICCTSSMALLLSEQVHQRGIADQIDLKKVICGSERTSTAMRRTISQGLSGVEIFDIPGLTELYGPGTGLECEAHDGIHYWADYYILELLDPVTLQPAEPGEIGEMVVTTLRKEAAPLIRYRTRDLTRLINRPCSCGSYLPRHERILGRSDDMIIYRAVNVYPGQIDHLLSASPGIGSEYQIVLTREQGKDYMEIKVERAEKGSAGDDRDLAAAIAGRIKSQILVSAKVTVVDHGALPRSERKSRRVFDHRYDD